MLKRIFVITVALIMVFCVGGCGQKETAKKEYTLPEYSYHEFEIGGGLSPYETSEETLLQYKNAGLNTLYFSCHDMRVVNSETMYYLGSERTMKTLELCKKTGLNAVLQYGDWLANWIEGEDYFSDTPFSQFDIYGEYKDIIKGVYIWDEPKKDELSILANKTQIDDFKKTYPNADYFVNLIPITANSQVWGYDTYQEMLDMYGELVMSQFEKPYISLDMYPFHLQAPDTDIYLASNYEMIAKTAKKYDAKTNFYLQASTGNEFEAELSEGDMRWEVNSALTFGAESLIYYCYVVPINAKENGTIEYMYDYCVLNRDNTPSKIYYYLQDIHKEIQSYADVILSYDWNAAKGIEGSKESAYRVSGIALNELEDAKHFVSATASHDLAIGHFVSEQYGEGYMMTNFADRDGTNKINVKFKDCRAVAVYGGVGYDGTPEIIELDEDGKFTRELTYGDGVFITPIK